MFHGIHELAYLIKWPKMEQVKKNRPKEFKYFPCTRVIIIDCLDFFVQRLGLPCLQRKDMELQQKS